MLDPVGEYLQEREATESAFRAEINALVIETGLPYGEAITRFAETRPERYANVMAMRLGGRPAAERARAARVPDAHAALRSAVYGLANELHVSKATALLFIQKTNPELYKAGTRAATTAPQGGATERR